ncbi:MAG: pentapeptide repeat-containing protein [Dolichospermum sp. JUN01]|nr:pentapeptide repeat-containing protein [Dolichospermum sp. JUN01]
MSKDQQKPQFHQNDLSPIDKNQISDELSEVKQLRDKFSDIAEISDPLTREYQFIQLEKEAAKSDFSAESYRRLFETYLQNKEHIHQYPKTWWSLIEWRNWLLKFPNKRKIGLVKIVLLTALEKGVLLSLAVTLFKYFQEAPKRQQQDHYQAWEIINSAIGQTASGGRIEALQDLNKDGVSLQHINANRADLSGINLDRALLSNVRFEKAILTCVETKKNTEKCTTIRNADLSWGHLQGANFYKADLRKSIFWNAEMQETRLIRANLQGADFEKAKLDNAYIDRANFIGAKNLTAEQVKSAKNWEKACYDRELRIQLNLRPDNPDYCNNNLK